MDPMPQLALTGDCTKDTTLCQNEATSWENAMADINAALTSSV